MRGLAPGVHDLRVVSDTGVEHVATITIPPAGPHWAYLTYWYYADDGAGAYVHVTEFDEPVAID